MRSIRNSQGRLSREPTNERTPKMSERPQDSSPLSDLELYTRMLDDTHGRGLEEAERWLLENPEEAHPRLVSLLETREVNPYAILRLLPRFGRPESVSVIESCLYVGGESLSAAAAFALADHPSAGALDALTRALDSSRVETRTAAADGLWARGDTLAGPALMARLEEPHAVVRYHVLQAAGMLGVLPRRRLEEIARRDADSDVRGLAETLLTKSDP